MFLRVEFRLPSSDSTLEAASLADETCASVYDVSALGQQASKQSARRADAELGRRGSESAAWDCPTHSLGLERGDRLELSLNVVVDGLEALEELLALGDDVLVLEDLAVVLEVDRRLLLLDGSVGGAGGRSTRTEGAQLVESLCRRVATSGCGRGRVE